MTYEGPIKALLDLGAVDAPQTYAVTADDLPGLQTLLCDESFYGHDDDDPRSWAMTHAVNAIVQLDGAAASQAALLQVIGRALNPSHLWQALTVAFVQIGADAIAPLAEKLRGCANNVYSGTGVLDALLAIAEAHEDTRDDVKTVIVAQLEDAANNDTTVNGTIIKWLTDARADDVLPVIEAAYKTEQVDKFVAGDWASVQVTFGVKDEDPDLGKSSLQLYRELGDDWKEAGSNKTDSKSVAQKKKKRKAAKAARKKNRKR